MGFPEELPLPLVQAPQELLAQAHAQILGGAGLAGVEGDLGGARDERLPQDGAELPLVEEVEHARPQAVEVVRLVAERHGAGVGLERRQDLAGQRGGQAERDERLRVVLGAPRRPVGEREELSEP